MANTDLQPCGKYFRCAHGLLMPDGNGWCSITMSFCHGCSDDYKPGSAKIYEIKLEKVPKEVKKIKVREIKPKPLPKVRSSKKIKPGQTRLF